MGIRTLPLPTAPTELWDDFAWPAKAPGDVLQYEVDFDAWARADGLVATSATRVASTGLTVSTPLLASVSGSNVPSRLTVWISGGPPDDTAWVDFTLHFQGGARLGFRVHLPIRAVVEGEDAAPPDPTIPAGALIDASGGLTDGYGSYLFAT